MATIDIKLPASVSKTLEAPKCLDIKLPKPGRIDLTLPSGSKLQGIADATKGVPDDCSVMFNLLLQLGPILANLHCVVMILQVLEKLKAVAEGLPRLDFAAVPDLLKALEELAPCFLVPTPGAMIPFVKDVLTLIAKVLKCMVGQLKSVMSIMGGLSLQIDAAQGNPALLQSLQCAQENAQQSAAYAMSGLEPIMALLGMMEPFLGIAGVDAITIPAMAPAEDLEAMETTVDTLEEVVALLEQIVDSLP